MSYVKHFLMIAAFLVVTMSGVAHAAWVTGTLTQVASNETQAWVTITATDGKFTGSRYFWLSGTNTNTMMATALSAQSAGKNVSLQVDSIVQGQICRAVLMNN